MSDSPTCSIGRDGLETAVTTGQEIFRQLVAGHPELKKELKGYLVLSRGAEQVGLTSSPLDILLNCPRMVEDDAAKRDALRLLSEKKRLESAGRGGSSVDRVSGELDTRLNELRFAPDVQIEIRFGNLCYEVIWALQKDPLIDRDLTPQTKASIRIVLGNIENLSRRKGPQAA